VAPGGAAAGDAQRQIGEIYFNKTNQYEMAIRHYRKWLKDNPGAPETAEFLYRIGRSQFFLFQFEEAIKTFESVLATAAVSAQAAESAYQIGMAHLSLAAKSRSTAGEDDGEDDGEARIDSRGRYRLAVKAFEDAERRYPASTAAQQAALGVVTAYEEQGLWEDAVNKLQEMHGKYPIPQILKIRMHRIQERLAKRTAAPKR